MIKEQITKEFYLGIAMLLSAVSVGGVIGWSICGVF